MNTEKIRSKIHFNLPSLLGLAAQSVLAFTWFTEPIDYCKGMAIQSFSTKEIIDEFGFLPAYYLNSLLVVLAVLPWIYATVTTSRRGDLLFPLLVSYLEAAVVIGFRFVFVPLYDEFKDVVTLNGYGIAMLVSAIASIILCHVAYIAIRRYRKSLKVNAQ